MLSYLWCRQRRPGDLCVAEGIDYYDIISFRHVILLTRV